MSSKHWMDMAIKKPASSQSQADAERENDPAKTSRRAKLAELLLKMQKEKG